MYERFVWMRDADPGARDELEWGREVFELRVHAQWGLIARGKESLPYALGMLRSTDADVREDAGGIVQYVGRDPIVSKAILDQLVVETDPQAKDSLILALGALRARDAIPVLEAIIHDESADGDTRHTAAESLGRIVRRNFLKQPDPIAAAKSWSSARGGK
jgi:hypothetical protein